MRRETSMVVLVLLLLIFMVNSSSAYVSYDIGVNVGGTGVEIHRETRNLTLTIDGSVHGFGNFSRLTHIESTTDIRQDEATSSTKKGNLSYVESKAVVSREGPVVIVAVLKSNTYNYTNEDQQGTSNTITVKSESADINVDEYWLAALANYNKINYKGPEIRSRERYENNGDIVASSIDSWDLSKQSIYRTYINKTHIDLNVIPGKVTEDLEQNKSSYYALESKSTGALTHLDLIKGSSTPDETSRISEDYKGQETLSLVTRMNGTIIRPTLYNYWLPCPCQDGWNDMDIHDQRYHSAEGFFDSNNCSLPKCANKS